MRSQTWNAQLKLDQAQTYRDYFDKIQDLARRVNRFLEQQIQGGGKVFGLGASTKGNVLLQFFGITKERMPYISERNPDKVGLRTLGTDFELDFRRARPRPSTQHHGGAAVVLQKRDRGARARLHPTRRHAAVPDAVCARRNEGPRDHSLTRSAAPLARGFGAHAP